MRDKKGYIYSSTELSRYYGISIKGMAFYEEKNLIHPERVGTGMMRRFNLKDCYRLASARMLHNCGFSLDETAMMLRDNTADVMAAHLDGRAEQLEREIRLQQGILSGVRRIEQMIRQVQQGETQPELTTMPAVRWLFIRRLNDAHTSTPEETNEFCHWNSMMPITEASLHIPLHTLIGETERMDTEIGMMIREEDFLNYGFEESGRITRMEQCPAIHGFICCDELELDQKRCLAEILQFAAANGLCPSGDSYSRLIFSLREKGKNIRWDEFWMPVAQP